MPRLSDLEYVLLRLARRFLFTEDALNRLGRFIPYYRTNQGQLDPRPIVAAYAAGLAKAGVSLAGKAVLELGSGATNAVGHELAGRYGCRVVCLEPFARLDAVADVRLKAEAAARHPGAALAGVSRETDLAAVPEASLDLVLSNSVLEHVGDPPSLFRGLARVLRPEGIMLHRVDYRDHFFKYPYHFLKFSKAVWERWLNPGNLPRWRLDDHLAAMAAAGLTARVVAVQSDRAAFDSLADSLHPDFSRRDRAIVAVTLATIVAGKASGPADS